MSTADQRRKIHQLTGYNIELKARLVQDITKGENTSTKDLSVKQAQDLINKLTKFWAYYTADNAQHKYILSLLHQLGWIKKRDVDGKTIPDMGRLSEWLKSLKSPVNKPLQDMSTSETSKIIFALEAMITKKYG